ncbi:MAG TPA: hypothetical protein VGO93_17165 [Candidatus Xenobia bacterium]
MGYLDVDRAGWESMALKACEIRDWAQRTASSDVFKAVEAAAHIPLPWYACQALATIAEVDAAHRRELLDAAFEAAAHGHDEYQRVAAASWPLGVAVRTGVANVAGQRLPALLEDLEGESNRGSKAYALDRLLAAVWNTPLRPLVVGSMKTALQDSAGWLESYIASHMVYWLATTCGDRPLALELLEAIPENRFKRQAQRRLQADGGQG